MERGSDQADSDSKNDLERAQRNLQRALAIDDGYMPAFNQLANYYLEQAKSSVGTNKLRSRRGKRGMEVSGASRVEANGQQLDLAALVASQAQLTRQTRRSSRSGHEQGDQIATKGHRFYLTRN